MPWQLEIECNHKGISRAYRVWFLDDPDARAEAVRFFGSAIFDSKFGKLFPSMDQPEQLDMLSKMSLEEANTYLQETPVLFKWESLRVFGKHTVDEDLDRLQHIPELKRVFLYDVSDEAVKRLLHLQSLEELILYSDKVTDRCFDVLSQLCQLQSIDLQRCQQLSHSACLKVVQQLKLEPSRVWLP